MAQNQRFAKPCWICYATHPIKACYMFCRVPKHVAKQPSWASWTAIPTGPVTPGQLSNHAASCSTCQMQYLLQSSSRAPNGPPLPTWRGFSSPTSISSRYSASAGSDAMTKPCCHYSAWADIVVVAYVDFAQATICRLQRSAVLILPKICWEPVQPQHMWHVVLAVHSNLRQHDSRHIHVAC